MLLSRFWRRHRRLLGWSIFVLAIAGLGVALYVMLPPEPRWVFADGPRSVFYAGDGKFATYRLHEDTVTGPVQLWDAAAAEELARFLTGEKPFRGQSYSNDGRYFVALVNGDRPDITRICGVDLHERREWQVDAAVGRFRSPVFSPRCDFVAALVSPADGDAEVRVIVETSSGRIVDRSQHRPGAEHDQGHFAAAGGSFVIGCRDEDEEMDYIRAVNTRTGKKTVLDNARFVAVSPDSRWLLADRGEDGLWVWDLVASSWHCRLEGAQGTAARNSPRGDVEFLFTGVSRTYRLNLNRSRLAVVRLWNRGTGRMAGWRRLGSITDSPVFSPDSRFILWNASNAGRPQLTFYDVEHKKQLWQRTWPEDADGNHLFTPDSRWLVVALSEQVEVLDVATGQTELTIRIPGSAELQARLTGDGRTLVVAAVPSEEPVPWLWTKIWDWLVPRSDTLPMVIHAFDMETGLPLGRLRTEETEEYWLTEDRRSLLTVYHENNDGRVIETTIRCWDMPPRKPLRWVVGVPLAAGALLVSLGAGWCKLRARISGKSSQGVSPCS